MATPRLQDFRADRATYVAGDVASISVSFDQAVTVDTFGGFRVPVLVLSNGARAYYSGGSGSDELRFQYNVLDTDRSSLDLKVVAFAENDATIRNSAGEDADVTVHFNTVGSLSANNDILTPSELSGGEIDKFVTVQTQSLSTGADLVNPKIASMSSVAGTYGVGTTLDIVVSFDEVVLVRTSGGVPTLQFAGGGNVLDGFAASYVGGSGTKRLTFRVEISEGMPTASSLDVLNLSLNGGVISDLSGNNANLTITAGTNNLAPYADIQVVGSSSSTGGGETQPGGDGSADVTAAVIESVQSIKGDGPFDVGDRVDLKVTLSEAVTLNTLLGSPVLALSNGGTAQYVSGSGTRELLFRYTVKASDRNSQDLDVIGVAENDASIVDAAGNRTDVRITTDNRLAKFGNVVIDAQAPYLRSVDAADDTYIVGDTITFTGTFSEAVSVTGTPGLNLSNGGVAQYVSGSGSSLLVFQYDVAGSSQSSADLDVLSLNVADGAFKSAVTGNAATVQVTPGILSFDADVLIDTSRPSGTISLDKTSLIANETASVTVSFGEPVADPRSAISVLNGTLSDLVTAETGDTGRVWTGTFTPALGVEDATNVLILDNTKVFDDAGNAGIGLAASANFLIDTRGPSPVVSSVAQADGSRVLTLDFGEPVTDLSESGLVVTNGIKGDLSKLSDSKYSLVVTPEASNPSGVIGLSLVDNHIKDALGNFNDPFTASFVWDETSPVIEEITSPPKGDGSFSYTTNDAIDIRVRFSEPVEVSPVFGDASLNPVLALSNGRVAAYQGGSGTNTLTFRYIVQSGDEASDLDSLALIENASRIHDASGNDAQVRITSGLNNLAFVTNIVIDGVVPSITNVSAADGLYQAGDDILLDVQFSEDVVLDRTGGDPILALSNGSYASFVSHDGDRMVFSYAVTTGDNDAQDLDVLGFAENGSALVDASGNRANVAIRFGINNLAERNEVNIDAARPQIAETSANAGEYKAGQQIEIALAMSKGVVVDTTQGDPSLRLNNGREAIFDAEASTPTKLVFVYDVLATDVREDTDTGTLYEEYDLSIASFEYNNAEIRSLIGGADALMMLPLSGLASEAVHVDLTLPEVVSISLSDMALAAGEDADVTVVLSEPVRQLDVSYFSVQHGSLSAFTTTDNVTWHAVYTPVRAVEASDLVISLDAARLSDAAGNLGSGVAQSAAYSLDSTYPEIEIRSDTAGVARGDVRFIVNFSEAVTGFTVEDLKVINGTIVPFSFDGPNAEGEYSVMVSPLAGSRQPIKVSVGVGAAADEAGNESRASSVFVQPVDTDAPRIEKIAGVKGSYALGDTISIDVTFTEAVTLQLEPELSEHVLPHLSLNNGQEAIYVAGSGGKTWTFEYVVSTPEDVTQLVDRETLKVLALVENDTSLLDAAGNKLEDYFVETDAQLNAGLSVDTTGAVITGFSSVDGTYKTDDVLYIRAHLSELVHVQGTPAPYLMLSNGGRATYLSGTGSSQLMFRYIVDEADGNASDLSVVSFNAPAAGIVDRAGNVTDLSIVAGENDLAAAHQIVVDTQAPELTGVRLVEDAGTASDVVNDGYYKAGTVLAFEVDFDDAVSVDVTNGTPILTLSNGSIAQYVGHVQNDVDGQMVDDPTKLRFEYTVQQDDINTQLLKVTGLAERGAKITDQAGNRAYVEVNDGQLNYTTAVVDTIAPTQDGSSDSFTANERGDDLARTPQTITVTFSSNEVIGVDYSSIDYDALNALTRGDLGLEADAAQEDLDAAIVQSIYAAEQAVALSGITVTFAGSRADENGFALTDLDGDLSATNYRLVANEQGVVDGTAFAVDVDVPDRAMGTLTVSAVPGALEDLALNANADVFSHDQAVDTQTVDFEITPAAGLFIGSTSEVKIYDSIGDALSAAYLLDPETGQARISVAPSAAYPNGYRGPVLVEVVDRDPNPDYIDEFTGQGVSLSNGTSSYSMRAVFNVVEPGEIPVTVSPVTELSVRKLFEAATPSAATPLDPAKVDQFNSGIAKIFGLSEIVHTKATVINSALIEETTGVDVDDFDLTDGASASEKYGQVLAMLSARDSQSGSLAATVDELAATIKAIPQAGQTTLAITQLGADRLAAALDSSALDSDLDGAGINRELLDVAYIDEASAAGYGLNLDEAKTTNVPVKGAEVGDTVFVQWGVIARPDTDDVLGAPNRFSVVIDASHVQADGSVRVPVPLSVIEKQGDANEVAVSTAVLPAGSVDGDGNPVTTPTESDYRAPVLLTVDIIPPQTTVQAPDPLAPFVTLGDVEGIRSGDELTVLLNNSADEHFKYVLSTEFFNDYAEAISGGATASSALALVADQIPTGLTVSNIVQDAASGTWAFDWSLDLTQAISVAEQTAEAEAIAAGEDYTPSATFTVDDERSVFQVQASTADLVGNADADDARNEVIIGSVVDLVDTPEEQSAMDQALNRLSARYGDAAVDTRAEIKTLADAIDGVTALKNSGDPAATSGDLVAAAQTLVMGSGGAANTPGAVAAGVHTLSIGDQTFSVDLSNSPSPTVADVIDDIVGSEGYADLPYKVGLDASGNGLAISWKAFGPQPAASSDVAVTSTQSATQLTSTISNSGSLASFASQSIAVDGETVDGGFVPATGDVTVAFGGTALTVTVSEGDSMADVLAGLQGDGDYDSLPFRLGVNQAGDGLVATWKATQATPVTDHITVDRDFEVTTTTEITATIVAAGSAGVTTQELTALDIANVDDSELAAINRALASDLAAVSAPVVSFADSILAAGESTTVSLTFSKRLGQVPDDVMSLVGGELSSEGGAGGPIWSTTDGLTWTATFTATSDIPNTTLRYAERVDADGVVVDGNGNAVLDPVVFDDTTTPVTYGQAGDNLSQIALTEALVNRVTDAASKVAAFADSQGDVPAASPSVQDFADMAVSGVRDDNLSAVQDALGAIRDRFEGEGDLYTQIQTVTDSYNAVFNTVYTPGATDQPSSADLVEDLINLGVGNLSADSARAADQMTLLQGALRAVAAAKVNITNDDSTVITAAEQQADMINSVAKLESFVASVEKVLARASGDTVDVGGTPTRVAVAAEDLSALGFEGLLADTSSNSRLSSLQKVIADQSEGTGSTGSAGIVDYADLKAVLETAADAFDDIVALTAAAQDSSYMDPADRTQAVTVALANIDADSFRQMGVDGVTDVAIGTLSAAAMADAVKDALSNTDNAINSLESIQQVVDSYRQVLSVASGDVTGDQAIITKDQLSDLGVSLSEDDAQEQASLATLLSGIIANKAAPAGGATTDNVNSVADIQALADAAKKVFDNANRDTDPATPGTQTISATDEVIDGDFIFDLSGAQVGDRVSVSFGGVTLTTPPLNSNDVAAVERAVKEYLQAEAGYVGASFTIDEALVNGASYLLVQADTEATVRVMSAPEANLASQADLNVLGFDAVDADNLDAIQRVLTRTDGRDGVTSYADLKAKVDAAVDAHTALTAVVSTAQSSIAPDLTGLNADTFSDMGIDGVDAGNYAAMLDALSNTGNTVDTAAAVQTVVDSYNVLLDLGAYSASSGEMRPAPATATDLINIGITLESGTEDAVAELATGILASLTEEAANSVAEAQAIVDAIDSVFANTLRSGEDDTTHTTVVVKEELEVLGFTGVTDDNLDAIQRVLSDQAGVADVKDYADLKQLVDAAITAHSDILTAATTDDLTGIDGADYAAMGVDGVDTDNLGSINDALIKSPNTLTTAASVQNVVDSYNHILDLRDGDANGGNSSITLDVGDFTDLGVTLKAAGAEQDKQMVYLQELVANNGGPSVASVADIQSLADATSDLIDLIQGTSPDSDSTDGLTIDQWALLGITTDADEVGTLNARLALTADNLSEVTNLTTALADRVQEARDAMAKIEAYANADGVSVDVPTVQDYSFIGVTGYQTAVQQQTIATSLTINNDALIFDGNPPASLLSLDVSGTTYYFEGPKSFVADARQASETVSGVFRIYKTADGTFDSADYITPTEWDAIYAAFRDQLGIYPGNRFDPTESSTGGGGTYITGQGFSDLMRDVPEWKAPGLIYYTEYLGSRPTTITFDANGDPVTAEVDANTVGNVGMIMQLNNDQSSQGYADFLNSAVTGPAFNFVAGNTYEVDISNSAFLNESISLSNQGNSVDWALVTGTPGTAGALLTITIPADADAATLTIQTASVSSSITLSENRVPVVDIDQNNLAAINELFAATGVGADAGDDPATNRSEVQYVIDQNVGRLGALAKIANYADNNGVDLVTYPAPDAADFAAAGVSGVADNNNIPALLVKLKSQGSTTNYAATNTAAELQAFVKQVAIEKIANWADSDGGNGAAPILQDYLNAGLVGPFAAPATTGDAITDAVVPVLNELFADAAVATDAADTLAQQQAIINGAQAQIEALTKIANYAEADGAIDLDGDANTGDANGYDHLTVADFEAAGISGVADGTYLSVGTGTSTAASGYNNLDAVLAKLAESGVKYLNADTVDKVQQLVSDVAVEKINAYADANGVLPLVNETIGVYVDTKTGGGNAFYLDGVEAPVLELKAGTYTFDQSDSTNDGHPLNVYANADRSGTLPAGITVTQTGTPGSDGAQTVVVVDETFSGTVSYQCATHDGMGNSAEVEPPYFTPELQDYTNAGLVEDSAVSPSVAINGNQVPFVNALFASASVGGTAANSDTYHSDTQANQQAMIDDLGASMLALEKFVDYMLSENGVVRADFSAQDFADAGLARVAGMNYSAILDRLPGYESSDSLVRGDLDNVAKIQAFVSRAIIAEYNADQANQAPTGDDYVAAGVTGADGDNFAAMNYQVETNGSYGDTIAALEGLVSHANDAINKLATFDLDHIAPISNNSQIVLGRSHDGTHFVAQTLALADFGDYTDPSNDALDKIKITSLPSASAGSLYLQSATSTATESTAGATTPSAVAEVQTLTGITPVANAIYEITVGGDTVSVTVDADPTGAELATRLDAALDAMGIGVTESSGDIVLTWDNTGPVTDVVTLIERSPVQGNAEIAVSDIQAGKLTYLPASTTAATSFDFKVIDDQGNASDADYTLSIDRNDFSPATGIVNSGLVQADTGVYSGGLYVNDALIGFEDMNSLRVVITATGGNVKIGSLSGSAKITTGFDDATTGGAEICIEGTQAQINAALKTMQAQITSGQEKVDISIDVQPGGVIYNPENGHFYSYISHPNGITWTDAKAEAASQTFYGLTGYLATPTSASENNLLISKVANNGWIGLTDRNLEGTWQWDAGPEEGQTVWTNTSGTANGAFSNWSHNQPDNAGANGEDYAMVFAGNSIPAGVTKGAWNDLDNSVMMTGAQAVWNTVGYFIEYGGMTGDVLTAKSGVRTLTVYATEALGNVSMTLTDFEQAGVTGVTEYNLASINQVLSGKSAADVDSNPELQSVVDSVVTAIAKIEDFNNGANGVTTLDVADYAAAGIVGVVAGNTDAVNSAIQALNADGTNSTAEIQAVVAQVRIETYADATDATGLEVPTVADYHALGIYAVDARNLVTVNSFVLDAATDLADNTDEIVLLVQEALEMKPYIDAVAKISAYADSDGVGVPEPTPQDYLDAQLVGVNEYNLGIANALFADSDVGTGDTTLAGTQSEQSQLLTNAANKLAAFEKIVKYGIFDGGPAPTAADFDAVGVTGVAGAGGVIDSYSNIDAVNGAVLDVAADWRPSTTTEVQELVNPTIFIEQLRQYQINGDTVYQATGDAFNYTSGPRDSYGGVDSANFLEGIVQGTWTEQNTGSDGAQNHFVITPSGDDGSYVDFWNIVSDKPAIIGWQDIGGFYTEANILSEIRLHHRDDGWAGAPGRMPSTFDVEGFDPVTGQWEVITHFEKEPLRDTNGDEITLTTQAQVSQLPEYQTYQIDAMRPYGGYRLVVTENINTASGSNTYSGAGTMMGIDEIQFMARNLTSLVLKPSLSAYQSSGITEMTEETVNAMNFLVNQGYAAATEVNEGNDSTAEMQSIDASEINLNGHQFTLSAAGVELSTSAVLSAAATLSDLVLALQLDSDFAAAPFTIAVNSDAIELTWKTPGAVSDTAILSQNEFTSIAGVRSIVTEAEAIQQDAYSLIDAYASDSNSTPPTVLDYELAGFTGVNEINLYAINRAVGMSFGLTDYATAKTIVAQGLTNHADAIADIDAYADAGTPVPTRETYLIAGINSIDEHYVDLFNDLLTVNYNTGDLDSFAKLAGVISVEHTPINNYLDDAFARQEPTTVNTESEQLPYEAALSKVYQVVLQSVGDDASAIGLTADEINLIYPGVAADSTNLANLVARLQGADELPFSGDQMKGVIESSAYVDYLMVKSDGNLNGLAAYAVRTSGERQVEGQSKVEFVRINLVDAQEGDVVKLYNGSTSLATVTVTSDHVTAGYINTAELDLSTGAVATGHATLRVEVERSGSVVSTSDSWHFTYGTNAGDALALIRNEAENNNADPHYPSYGDYAVAGVTGVTKWNLSSINDALNSTYVNSAALGSLSDVQAIVDAVNRILDPVDRATDATEADFETIGLLGSGDNASLVTKLLEVITSRPADEINSREELAVDLIEVYNRGTGSDFVPLSIDTSPELYTLAGITGVDTNNLADINALVLAQGVGGADTQAKIQAIVDAWLTQPTQTISIEDISNDTGKYSTDFITSDDDGLTVSAILSAPLVTGQFLEYSNNNGATWIDITSDVIGVNISHTDPLLTSSATIKMRVTNGLAAGVIEEQAIVIDNVPPVPTLVSTSASDVIVKSTEISKAYLVSSSLSFTSEAAIQNEATNLWTSVDITAANTDVTIALSSLTPGTYQLYLVDDAGNLGVYNTGITVGGGTDPDLSVSGANLEVEFGGEPSHLFLVNDNNETTPYNSEVSLRIDYSFVDASGATISGYVYERNKASNTDTTNTAVSEMNVIQGVVDALAAEGVGFSSVHLDNINEPINVAFKAARGSSSSPKAYKIWRDDGLPFDLIITSQNTSTVVNYTDVLYDLEIWESITGGNRLSFATPTSVSIANGSNGEKYAGGQISIFNDTVDVTDKFFVADNGDGTYRAVPKPDAFAESEQVNLKVKYTSASGWTSPDSSVWTGYLDVGEPVDLLGIDINEDGDFLDFYEIAGNGVVGSNNGDTSTGDSTVSFYLDITDAAAGDVIELYADGALVATSAELTSEQIAAGTIEFADGSSSASEFDLTTYDTTGSNGTAATADDDKVILELKVRDASNTYSQDNGDVTWEYQW